MPKLLAPSVNVGLVVTVYIELRTFSKLSWVRGQSFKSNEIASSKLPVIADRDLHPRKSEPAIVVFTPKPSGKSTETSDEQF